MRGILEVAEFRFLLFVRTLVRFLTLVNVFKSKYLNLIAAVFNSCRYQCLKKINRCSVNSAALCTDLISTPC